MKSAFSVRELEPGDAPAIQALARTLETWFGSVGLAQIPRDLQSHHRFVAVRAKQLVGFAVWIPVDEATAELSWIGVAEDMHHRGIGTAVLAALTSELRRKGFQHLTVSALADTFEFEPYAETRRFYRARGFKEERVDPRYWSEDNTRYDRLVLRLELECGTAAHVDAR